MIATVCIVGLPVLAQNRGGRGANPTQAATAAQTAKPPVKIAGDFDKVHILEPGAPTPRTRDGHPDLSGRYYPNHAGRMLQGAYRIPDPIMRQYDPVKTPQENPVFRPDAVDKYLHATPYGSCPPGGTPTSITTQATEHGPLELVQVPGRIWMLTEFPQTIRMVPTDGRPHPPDPDTSFNGDSVAHWEGDTLVVDTIGFNEKEWLLGREGMPTTEALHLIERFSRPDFNTLRYEPTIDDPGAYTKPWSGGWNIRWVTTDMEEYFCQDNERDSLNLVGQ